MYLKGKNEQYPDFACSHEPYYYLDLHELNFPDRDERGCGLVNMTVHDIQRIYQGIKEEMILRDDIRWLRADRSSEYVRTMFIQMQLNLPI